MNARGRSSEVRPGDVMRHTIGTDVILVLSVVPHGDGVHVVTTELNLLTGRVTRGPLFANHSPDWPTL